jgi:hypothetical protein
MKIFIKTITGKLIEFEVEPHCTVSDVKDKILEYESQQETSRGNAISVDNLRLWLNRQLLENHSFLVADLGLQDNSILDLTYRFRG